MTFTPITLTIVLDDTGIDIDIDPSHTVGELIRKALSAFGVHEDQDGCFLSAPDRHYYPVQTVSNVGLESGDTLNLRLPC